MLLQTSNILLPTHINMAAEPQLLFDLFDSHWFAHRIFNKNQNPHPQPPKNEESVAQTSQNLDFAAVPTINMRSYSDQLEIKQHEEQEITAPLKKKMYRGARGRKAVARSKSKSLSELEFEELKGFMDLGFLFTEKDKDSSLVSMIPGLQRLGKDEEEEVQCCLNVSRPYLSEAWGDLEMKRKEATRLIRIPVVGNKSDMKHQIRFWAHSVASVVR